LDCRIDEKTKWSETFPKDSPGSKRDCMGRLKRKRPASPKKKGRKKSTKADNRKDLELRETTAEKSTPKAESAPKAEEKKALSPKPIRPSGLRIQPAFWGKATQFLREVKIELKKVTWPSRKETIGSTAVVIILVIIVSAFLGLVDMGLSSLIRLVLQ
jgi:preprotein translocase subunit SecE